MKIKIQWKCFFSWMKFQIFFSIIIFVFPSPLFLVLVRCVWLSSIAQTKNPKVNMWCLFVYVDWTINKYWNYLEFFFLCTIIICFIELFGQFFFIDFNLKFFFSFFLFIRCFSFTLSNQQTMSTSRLRLQHRIRFAKLKNWSR